MPWKLTPYEDHLIPAVRALNERLLAGNLGAEFLLDERNPDPGNTDHPMRRQQWLLMQGEHVRAGILLQEQAFKVGDNLHTVANIQTPVSEGRANQKYVQAAGVMMMLLQKQQPPSLCCRNG